MLNVFCKCLELRFGHRVSANIQGRKIKKIQIQFRRNKDKCHIEDFMKQNISFTFLFLFWPNVFILVHQILLIVFWLLFEKNPFFVEELLQLTGIFKSRDCGSKPVPNVLNIFRVMGVKLLRLHRWRQRKIFRLQLWEN